METCAFGPLQSQDRIFLCTDSPFPTFFFFCFTPRWCLACIILGTRELRVSAPSLVTVLGSEEGEKVDGDSWTQTRMAFSSLFSYNFIGNYIYLVQESEIQYWN